jgi:hypothetical protein
MIFMQNAEISSLHYLKLLAYALAGIKDVP